MTTAAELREALERVTRKSISRSLSVETVIDAARTIALPILEADPELWARVSKVVLRISEEASAVRLPDDTMAGLPVVLNLVKRWTDEILAAISTPTPVEES